MKKMSFSFFSVVPALVIFTALASGFLSCATVARVEPVVRRIVVLSDSARIYGIAVGEARSAQILGVARLGDTLISYATAQLRADTLERYYYVIFQNKEGWLNSGNGAFARTEYDLLANVCDTKFFVSGSQDSLAWKRALEYVARHSGRKLQTMSETLIENSARGKVSGSELDVVFWIKRSPQKDGAAYSVRADGNASALNARKCALYIQTGKDEQDFQGMENIRSALKGTK